MLQRIENCFTTSKLSKPTTCWFSFGFEKLADWLKILQHAFLSNHKHKRFFNQSGAKAKRNRGAGCSRAFHRLHVFPRLATAQPLHYYFPRFSTCMFSFEFKWAKCGLVLIFCCYWLNKEDKKSQLRIDSNNINTFLTITLLMDSTQRLMALPLTVSKNSLSFVNSCESRSKS